MDWSKSYTSRWRVFKVNRETWADSEMLAKVDSASVSKTADGSMLESGSLEVTGELETGYYRIVMTAQQGGDVERVDVATLLFEVKGGNIDYGRTVSEVDGHSVLYPAYTTAVTIGEYAPAGVDGVQYAKALLESAINAPVEAKGSFILNDHVVHELGASVLEAVWAVLDAGGYVMQIDGRGMVHIIPKPDEPSLTLNNMGARLLTNGVDFSYDTSAIPNRYIVIDDDIVTIASNDDPDSSISTVARGYFVDLVDTSPTPVNGETRQEYADRKLKEASIARDERTYVREYSPSVYPYSLIRASADSFRMANLSPPWDMRVTSQSIECENGIKVTEKAYTEIPLW